MITVIIIALPKLDKLPITIDSVMSQNIETEIILFEFSGFELDQNYIEYLKKIYKLQNHKMSIYNDKLIIDNLNYFISLTKNKWIMLLDSSVALEENALNSLLTKETLDTCVLYGDFLNSKGEYISTTKINKMILKPYTLIRKNCWNQIYNENNNISKEEFFYSFYTKINSLGNVFKHIDKPIFREL